MRGGPHPAGGPNFEDGPKGIGKPGKKHQIANPQEGRERRGKGPPEGPRGAGRAVWQVKQLLGLGRQAWVAAHVGVF